MLSPHVAVANEPPSQATSDSKAQPELSPGPRVPQRFQKQAQGEVVTWSPRGGHVVSYRLGSGKRSDPFRPFEISQDSMQLQLLIPPAANADSMYTVETAAKSMQYADGTRVFVASDAMVQTSEGKPVAQLESHPGNYRIGFWTSLDDRVVWDFGATRWGKYQLDITYSLAGKKETDVEVHIAGGKSKLNEKIKGQLTPTGSWYRYTTTTLGEVYLPAAGKHQLQVLATKKHGAAAMNLKAVILRPTGEGKKALGQDADGNVLLHSRDATVHGVTLRYEPKPIKNTLGYWANPNDQASWTFKIDKPGSFDVEILQGCGRGQGGSQVAVFVGRERLDFTVEDTGHFQNFKPRVIGRVTIAKSGDESLWIVPLKKAKGAVMDVRQVRLLAVE